MAEFKCRGCQLTSGGQVFIDEVVHDDGCIFYKPEKTFEDEVIDAVVSDIKKSGRIAEALKRCA